ncbi:hypothetical protein PBOI14_32530 [Pseudomonas sp. Boi14]|nr:hypothetical protein PBOI14_32530 [Pseudomonas sp. Boi14]
MKIRPRVAADDALLTALWERSVRATHDFIAEDDIQRLYPLVRDSYLPALEAWVWENPDASPGGFIATSDDTVQMLFIEPAQRGQGIGRKLLDHVRRPGLKVDVNEQNPRPMVSTVATASSTAVVRKPTVKAGRFRSFTCSCKTNEPHSL